MNLRIKMFLLSGLSFVLLVAVVYLILRTFVLQNYAEVERQMVERNINQAVNAVNNHLDQMDTNLADWSNWTDTYNFALSGDLDFVDANLYPDTFRILNVNWMVFLKPDGTTQFAKGIDLKTGAELAVPPYLTNSEAGSLRDVVMIGTPVRGFVQLPQALAYVAARPIYQNEGMGESAGTLLWGRLIDDDEVASLTHILSFPVYFYSFTESLPASPAASLEIKVQPESDTLIHGEMLLTDLFGRHILSIGTVLPRTIYRSGLASLDYFLLALITLGVIFTILAMLFQERFVLGRLMYLSETVRTIGQSENFNLRVRLRGNDELAQLGEAINHFLGAVTQSRGELQQLNAQLEARVAERIEVLEYQRAHLQAILDNMGDGVIYCVNRKIQFANTAMAQMLSCEPSELNGRSIASLYSDDTQAQRDYERVAQHTDVQRFEAQLLRANKTAFNASITLTPLAAPDGEQRRVVLFRDISREKELEAQRIYFFDRASHDLRNPLTNIMTRLYLLRKTPEQLEKHLDILDEIVEHMHMLLNDLLDVTRLEQRRSTETWQTLNLQAIAAKVIEIQRVEAEIKDIHLSQTPTDAPICVFGDALRLNQMLTNLVSNAIHYTLPGGQVWVDIGQVNGCARISVHDTGQGIPSDHLSDLFQPFYRVHEDGNGTGLGLYIVKEISELHGGRVSVESTIGQGSTFTVTLPLILRRPPPG